MADFSRAKPASFYSANEASQRKVRATGTGHSTNTTDSPGRIELTPAMPRPQEALIDDAAVELPRLLVNQDGGHCQLRGDELASLVCGRGHTPAAAQWAIRRMVDAGWLTAHAVASPNVRQASLDQVNIRATSKLGGVWPICGYCSKPLAIADLDRDACHACRTGRGRMTELAIAFACLEKYGAKIPGHITEDSDFRRMKLWAMDQFRHPDFTPTTFNLLRDWFDVELGFKGGDFLMLTWAEAAVAVRKPGGNQLQHEGSTANGGEPEGGKQSGGPNEQPRSDDNEWLTVPQLAKRYGLDERQKRALSAKLARWRRGASIADYGEVQEHGKNQPKYFYRIGAIRHLLG